MVHVRRRARPGAVNRARNTRARHGESIVHLDTGASRPPDRRRETPLHSFELLRLSVLELALETGLCCACDCETGPKCCECREKRKRVAEALGPAARFGVAAAVGRRSSTTRSINSVKK